jgi:hypothetical protein
MLKARSLIRFNRQTIKWVALFIFIIFGIALGLTFRTSLLKRLQIGFNSHDILNPVEKKVLADKHPKVGHVLSRTLPWPTLEILRGAGKDLRSCYFNSLIVPDNHGGVFIKSQGVNDYRPDPRDSRDSILHYKADGSVSVVFSDNHPNFSLSYGGMALDSKNTLYVPSIELKRELSPSLFAVPIGRIVDFPKNQIIEPYIGMASHFKINLLKHCSELPDLCQIKQIVVNSLCHLSVDANDNLYLGLGLPLPYCYYNNHVQVMLLKIEPSHKVVHIGNFPRLRMDPQTNAPINIPDPSDAYYPPSTNFSLVVDSQENIFIHQYNVLLEFPKLQEGYGPVKIVRTMNSEANSRSIASSPDGLIYFLDREEKTVWHILPNFNLAFILGLSNQFGFSFVSDGKDRLMIPTEIACDTQGRLFIYDEANRAIVVYR